MELTLEKIQNRFSRGFEEEKINKTIINTKNNKMRLSLEQLVDTIRVPNSDPFFPGTLDYISVEDPAYFKALNYLISKGYPDPYLKAIINFDHPHKMGNQGVGGITMYSGSSTNKTYVLKGSSKRDELILEYAAGYFATNKLRNYIPNFAGMLGLFSCSPPVFNADVVAAYCSSSKAYHYLVYEPIEGPTLYEFLVTCTLNQFQEVLAGLMYALEFAYNKSRFTHYDLHYHNVIVRTLPQPITIDYGFRKLTTKYVPVIIDYGNSYFEYEGKSYGYVHDYTSKQLRPSPNHDVFKILGFSLNRLRTTKNPIYPQVKGLIKKFNIHLKDTDIDFYLEKLFPLYYLYPQNYKPYSLNKTEMSILKPSSIFSLPDSRGSVIYGCRESCISTERALKLLPEKTSYLTSEGDVPYHDITLELSRMKAFENKQYSYQELAEYYDQFQRLKYIVKIMNNATDVPKKLGILYTILGVSKRDEFNKQYREMVKKLQFQIHNKNKKDDLTNESNFLETVREINFI